jgi:hypothetical protein
MGEWLRLEEDSQSHADCITTYHHHRRLDDFFLGLARRNSTAGPVAVFAVNIGLVVRIHSPLNAVRHEIAADFHSVVLKSHRLGDHSHRSENHQRRLGHRGSMVVVGQLADQHNRRCPKEHVSQLKARLIEGSIPDDNHIYIDHFDAGVPPLHGAVALSLFPSSRLLAASSVQPTVESAHADAFAAPWQGKST